MGAMSNEEEPVLKNLFASSFRGDMNPVKTEELPEGLQFHSDRQTLIVFKRYSNYEFLCQRRFQHQRKLGRSQITQAPLTLEEIVHTR